MGEVSLDLESLETALNPGFYRFRFTGVTGDLADFDQTIYVAIPGDDNLDGQVSVLEDAFVLIGNLGVDFSDMPGPEFTDGDFNDDGAVSVLGDAFILIGNLGVDVRP